MKGLIKRRDSLRKDGKRGFTLIEVIVVLVILAILAAIAIPALTGYIDKANQRAAVSQAAVVRTSLQAIASDSYTTGAPALANGSGTSTLPSGYNSIGAPANTTYGPEIRALTGTNIPARDADLSVIEWSGRTLSKFVVKIGDYTVTFENDEYKVAKTP